MAGKGNAGGGTFAALQSRLAQGKKVTTPTRLQKRAKPQPRISKGNPRISTGNPTFAVKK